MLPADPRWGQGGRGARESHCGVEGTSMSMERKEARGGQRSPRQGVTEQTLQSPLSSDRGPGPYLRAKGRLCMEGGLSGRAFQKQMCRQTR